MSNTKTSSGKKARSVTDIRQAYIDYILTEGKRPSSVFKFCKDLGLREADFYAVAGSFDALEGIIWNDFISGTIQRLSTDAEYAGFTTREKLLTFYFALFEELKLNRSFVLHAAKPRLRPEAVPAFLKPFRKSFLQFINELINQGRQSGDIASRPYLEKTYPQLFWLHLCFLLIFWMNDGSANFEQTDAAIEKSVNLAFDLIGKGAVDSALDFAKFLYQSGMN
ncbi:MAG: TetR family transcriptional regulator C-terminal domain-containing protein [Cyclobacteriaceae bacterium]|nr:TetR family transcriptional regulator C-terminal domain-containing protein [Cyclobacteriaceae bacterium]MCX7636297.1 TetR family transcriptional regulator C-terminal domain-containing protein [Cyclobacteriaceae bacterium]MDW8330874.1 TetR family transcriptional regulator C-terminal domain-containing protein [Cyclobacteriaceae bacterium]